MNVIKMNNKNFIFLILIYLPIKILNFKYCDYCLNLRGLKKIVTKWLKNNKNF
jgi:hypothetical protein